MQAIAYYIALPFIYVLALIPYPLFHGVCDIVYVLIYYLIGYRKKVVRTNLQRSFPEKSRAEIRRIERRFYRYFCDLFLETFKTLVFSRPAALRHCSLDESAVRLFDDYYNRKQSLILVLGHFGNWEWAGNAFSLQCGHQLYVIYHPLKNRYFNRLIVHMRTRFGTRLVPMRDTFREMVRYRQEVSATAFIADQTPAPENACWTSFLNQDTPVFWGTERIARKLNYPVVYVCVRRTGRGRYRIFAETLFEEPARTPEGEITLTHTRRLEQEIRQQPEIWLWSHRRWKHKRPLVNTL
ncbi:MAG: lysophospholipid acyltransferase family protein [Bacteroidota bacterium]